ncbi:MAG: TatD family hydrolase [Clostridiales bacterium]|jgi:TatD DNase family protein|nr:TatD family hydrolase [Clostridiales bacterium]
MSEYIDTHAHYDDLADYPDREEVLRRLEAEGVSAVINAGSTPRSVREGLALARAHGFIWAAAGLHPNCAEEITEAEFAEMAALARSAILKKEKLVAIGETGLDYHYSKNTEIQARWFRRHLALARELELPVIIHSREAGEDTMNILKEETLPAGGVIHCFSGDLAQAREYIAMGFHIGVGGVVTFKKAEALKKVAAEIPIESLLLETDCPYLSPEPRRGERNDSANLKYIAAKIAELRGVSADELLEKTNASARKLFRLI